MRKKITCIGVFVLIISVLFALSTCTTQLGGDENPIITPTPTSTPMATPTGAEGTPTLTPTGDAGTPTATLTGVEGTPTLTPTGTAGTPTAAPTGVEGTPTTTSPGLESTPTATATPTGNQETPTVTPDAADFPVGDTEYTLPPLGEYQISYRAERNGRTKTVKSGTGYTMVWVGSTMDSQDALYFQKLDADGRAAGYPIQLETTGVESDGRFSFAYAENTNTYMVVWRGTKVNEFNNPVGRLLGIMLDSNGQKMNINGDGVVDADDDIIIQGTEDATAVQSGSWPDVASDGTNFAVTYGSNTAGSTPSNVIVALYDATGTAVNGSSVTLDTTGKAFYPRITYNPTEDLYAIVYQDKSFTTSEGIPLAYQETMFATVNGSGSVVTAATQVTEADDNYSMYAVAAAAGSQFGVAFMDIREVRLGSQTYNSNHIRFVLLDKEGNKQDVNNSGDVDLNDEYMINHPLQSEENLSSLDINYDGINFIIAWNSQTPGANVYYKAVKVESSQISISYPQQLNTQTGTGGAEYPTIAVNNNKVLITWYNDEDNPSQIYGAIEGGSIGPEIIPPLMEIYDEQIGDGTYTLGSFTEMNITNYNKNTVKSKVVATDSGYGLVRDGSNQSSQSTLFYQKLDSSGAVSGSEVELTQSSNGDGRFAIAYAAGKIMLVYQGYNGTDSAVFAKIINADDGSEAVAEFVVQGSGPDSADISQKGGFPDIATDGTNFAIVYATQNAGSTPSNVHFVLYNTSGIAQLSNALLIDDNYFDKSFYPQIAYNSTENLYGIVWLDYRLGTTNGVHEVWFASVNQSGSIITGEKAITIDDNYSSTYPRITAIGSNFGIAFLDSRPVQMGNSVADQVEATHVRFVLTDKTGLVQDINNDGEVNRKDELIINHPEIYTELLPGIDIEYTGSDIVVAWCTQSPGAETYYQAISLDGNNTATFSTPIKLNQSNDGIAGAYYSSIAVRGTIPLIIWTDDRTGTAQAYAAVF